MSLRFGVIVPTLNPGRGWADWLGGLERQSIKPACVVVVDSESDDGHLLIPDLPYFSCRKIARSSFNHGKTRQWAFEQVAADLDVVVFMTQDAVLRDADSLARLLAAFGNESVAAAYGRQVPRSDASPLSMHARRFNYGPDSMIKQWADRERWGIKTCFLSNSFSAYRCRALDEIGGFPSTDFGEDMLVAARLLMADRQIAYVADACVFHSHDFSLREEFRRYRAMGEFHKKHPWLMEQFGRATGEGWRFVRSEGAFLLRHAPFLLPSAATRTLLKFFGYRLGRK